MKNLFPIILVFIVFACGRSPENNTVEESVVIKDSTRFSKLDFLFQDMNLDTFIVYSDDPGNKAYAFVGSAMDSLQVALLPSELKYHYTWNKDFGACYQFKMDSNKTILITRVPSEYVSSKLVAMIFDHQKDSVIKTIAIADIVGDAGEVWGYTSCIFKTSNNNIHMLVYGFSQYDHRANGIENDTIVENWKSFMLLNLSNNLGDTISKDSATIVNKHPSIIQKLYSL